MSFFKKNSYDIIKLYINQIGITIFSLVIYIPFGDIEDSMFNRVQIALSVFAVLFYLCLVYTVVWDIAAKDKIRIDGGKMEPDKLKGLKMSLFANLPNFVLSISSLVFVLIYVASSVEGFKTAFTVLFMILKLHGAMFLGFINGVTPTFETLSSAFFTDAIVECTMYMLLPLLSVAVCQLAYFLGSQDKKIFGFLSSKKKRN